MMATASAGTVHAAGWMGEGPGRESGYGGGGGRGGRYPAGEGSSGWQDDGIPRGAFYSGGTARREGGRRADEPIKKRHLADGRGGAWVGRVG